MDDFIELEEHFGAHNYHPLPVVLTRGKGIWVWDEKGKKYLDMLSAYSAVSHGHAHPRLVKALKEQAEKIAVASRAFYTDKLGPLLQKLCALSGLDMGLPMNTGAEAVETAIKAARRWGYQIKEIPKDKAEIIVAEGNFHGRTTTIVGFSSEEAYKEGFGPFTPGFKLVPFGSASALEKAITPNTCAFLVEPIQGEAGIIIPPADYLEQAAKICRKHNVLLILDEVQSGLGRTGKMFAFQHAGIKPDGLILGKALGGGLLPVSAFLSRRDIMQLFTPGSHGSTFGGNPLAAAVASEALNVLKEEELVQKSAELGSYFLEKLKNLRSPLVSSLRGIGLWIGIVIDPAKASARAVCEKLMEKGLLAKETHQVVVRLAPPLVITREEIDWAVEQISQVLSEMQ
ncbi:MAG: ornithine--oxo-acid transaminase [Verrucomicrobia bacterium]|nr:ornithine--oxo-acid transaminase [Verrucomicrobiota bacterium]